MPPLTLPARLRGSAGAAPAWSTAPWAREATPFSAPLPPVGRPGATIAVADVTEWFGDTSGGIRTYLLEKQRYVAARPAVREVLVVPGSRDAIDVGDGHVTYALRGPRIPRQHPYRFMLATRTLSRILAHERPDVIEVGSPFLTPWMVRRIGGRLDIPVVAFYHTNLPRLVAPRLAGDGVARHAAARVLRQYLRALHGPLPVTVCSSRFAAEELARIGLPRVAEVPLGVDLGCFRPRAAADRRAERVARGLPTDAPVAAYVGRFAGEKRIEVVLDAWAAVERATGCRLALVGAGPIAARLRAHPYAARVHFLPYEPDRTRLAALLASLDLYVAPGPVETFGLSALEALSSGVPVLSTDQGGVSEFVTASGAGACWRTGDAAMLAETAIALLGRDLRALGAVGRGYAEREHAWPTVFDRLFALYRRVVADA